MCEDGSSPQTLSCGPHLVLEQIHICSKLFVFFLFLELCSVGYVSAACSFYVWVLIRPLLFLPFDLSSVYVSSTVPSTLCSGYDFCQICSIFVLSLFRLRFGFVPYTAPSTVDLLSIISLRSRLPPIYVPSMFCQLCSIYGSGFVPSDTFWICSVFDPSTCYSSVAVPCMFRSCSGSFLSMVPFVFCWIHSGYLLPKFRLRFASTSYTSS